MPADRDESRAKIPVVYIHSDELVSLCDRLPKIPERASMVHELICAYGLLREATGITIIRPVVASRRDLEAFHTEAFVDMLKEMSADSTEDQDAEKYEEFGLVYDCPWFEGVYQCSLYLAGATISAAHCLTNNISRIAINWFGGWHHAKRDEAAGFCYINDVVLGIIKLRQTFSRIMYIDLDLHHGDGVEGAFSFSNKVLTVSFHKHDIGFYPGTGALNEDGPASYSNFTVNVPLRDGITDEQYFMVVTKILSHQFEKFEPEAVVCQCGVDTLISDELRSFNLSIDGVISCVQFIASWKLPLLLLGGGGYNFTDTAKCWAKLTAALVNKELDNEIPDHRFFLKYGPDYSLECSICQEIPNKNTEEYLQSVYDAIVS